MLKLVVALNIYSLFHFSHFHSDILFEESVTGLDRWTEVAILIARVCESYYLQVNIVWI